MEPSQSEQKRLRPHPAQRFSGVQHAFDLKQELAAIRAEAHEANNGHHQKTLFRQPPVTQVLFAFSVGGELKEHRANGLVSILCLEGELEVGLEGETENLAALESLVLAPNVPHSVRAKGEAGMLLTVTLQ